MNKNRLEAFSDGVMAIVITIMVLEMKTPANTTFAALLPILPVFLSYVLSFIYLGIYWINHHQLIHAAGHINTRVLWANLFWLFWISLIPFTTSWVGENHLEPIPVAFYGGVLLLCALSFRWLEKSLIHCPGADARLAGELKQGWKEWISVGVYLLCIPMAFLHVLISIAGYVAIALLWTIPSRSLSAQEATEAADEKKEKF